MNIRELKNANEIKDYLDNVNSQYVKVAITDIDGVLRGKYMPTCIGVSDFST